MVHRIPLDLQQKELLCQFVEADRKIPSGKQRKFLALDDEMFGTVFVHLGQSNLQVKGSLTDAEILSDKGLMKLTQADQGGQLFHVQPEGTQYYSELKQIPPPVEAVETEIVRHLMSDEFGRLYDAAYQKWSDAAALLWGSDSQKQFTTIGHLCREAIQGFAETLVQQHTPTDSDPDKAHTVARVRSVLRARQDKLGSSEKAFLNALLAYWGTVSDLVHRQVHDAQQECERLTWEDARRTVFQTCIVMYEVHRAMTR
jgi:hypothetical protein